MTAPGGLSLTHLEELSLNGWPALHTLAADGWLLRLSNGYTRRANSVQPLYPGTRPLDEKIAAAESAYRGRGLPVVFKLTPASQPPQLDARLEALGYALDAPTSVQVLPLAAGPPPAPSDTACFDTLADEWLDAFCALSQVAERHTATMRLMLTSLIPAHAFFLRRGPHGQPVACGLAVLEAGHVGLADIVTHPAHRRQGHARRLIHAALAWARAHGAHTAYLQVMLNNAPALALYGGLGYVEVYRYWYRVMSTK